MLQKALNCQTEVQNWIEKEIGKEAVVGSFFFFALIRRKKKWHNWFKFKRILD